MEDLIRRSDAIKLLEQLSVCKEYGVEIGTDDETYIGKYEAITGISDIPAVEPKQGEWIDKGADLDGTWYYQCSNCHADVIEEQYPNCPYCLARMKGADNETD